MPRVHLLKLIRHARPNHVHHVLDYHRLAHHPRVRLFSLPRHHQPFVESSLSPTSLNVRLDLALQLLIGEGDSHRHRTLVNQGTINQPRQDVVTRLFQLCLALIGVQIDPLFEQRPLILRNPPLILGQEDVLAVHLGGQGGWRRWSGHDGGDRRRL